MEEDTEVLDWGNEDDEQQGSESYRSHQQKHSSEQRDDAEDAVSLGGDDDDIQDFSAYQSRPEQDSDKGQSASSRSVATPQQQQQQSNTNKRDLQREPSGASHSSRKTESPQQLRRSQSLSIGKLTHALPPKPVLVAPSFVHSSPPQTSTLASSMVHRERRSNGQSMAVPASETGDSLPLDWEIRYPRDGGHQAYYYNVKTHESTWTHPGALSGGRASPSKDRDNHSLTRSPRSSIADDSARSQPADKIGARGRKEPKRHPSPNGDSLSYEDRHYRPSEASQTGNNDAFDRRDDRPSRRAPSPIVTDGRRHLRSVTPPRRDLHDQERIVHSRRDFSPPPSPVGQWRDGQRDAPPSRMSPVPDRDWDRSRNMVSTEDIPTRSLETRASRGRRQRVDVEQPSQLSRSSQEQNVRGNDTRDWPAHSRHRSPPSHLHEPSPLNARRAMQPLQPSPPPAMTSRSKSRYDRSPSPLTQDRAPLRGRDVYIPVDLIPQRRGRDLESPERVSENDNKRRRVNERLSDPPPPPRRAPDRGFALPSSASLPDRPVLSLGSNEPEQPRRKRAPLPPQSTRFKEASKIPASTLPPPPPPINTPPTHASYTPSRPSAENGVPTRPAAYADIPSGPRMQVQPPMRDQDIDRNARGPPTRPGGRPRTRFDAPTASTPTAAVSVNPDRDLMDIDHPSPRQLSQRTDELPNRSGSVAYPERLAGDAQTESLPRGPRAMNKVQQSNTSSPSTPFNAPRAMQEPVSAPARMRNRPPPPHLAAATSQEPWAMRRAEAPSPYPKGPAADTTQRRYDDVPEGPSSHRRASAVQEPLEAMTPVPRELPARPGRRIPEGPAPKLSGTNSVPIGSRRNLITGLTPEPPALPSSRSPVEHYRPLANEQTSGRYDPPAPKYQDDYSYPPEKVSPANQYRTLPPVDNSSRRPSVSSRDTPMNVDRYPPPSQRPHRDSMYGQSDRPARQSRFGPGPETSETPTELSDSDRVWVARQEHESTGRTGRPQDAPRSANPPSSTSSWVYDADELPNRYPDVPAQSQRYEGAPRSLDVGDSTPPRRGRQQDPPPPRNRDLDIPQRISLEGRLSSQYDYPMDDGYRSVPPQTTTSMRSKGRDVGYPQEQYRQPYDEEWDEQRSYRGERGNWDRSANAQPDDASYTPRRHHDQTRVLEHHPLPKPPMTEPEPSRTSKPVRIRRPGKSPNARDDFGSAPGSQGNGYDRERGVDVMDHPEGMQRPGVKRGGSLLDRLSLNSPSPAPAPSLRDRVDIPMKRPNEGLPDLPPMPTPMSMDSEGLTGGGDVGSKSAGRGKRRSGKPRRGKKNGAA